MTAHYRKPMLPRTHRRRALVLAAAWGCVIAGCSFVMHPETLRDESALDAALAPADGAAVDAPPTTLDGSKPQDAAADGDAATCVRPTPPTCDGPCPPTELLNGLDNPMLIAVEQAPCGAGHVVWSTNDCRTDGGTIDVSVMNKDGSGRQTVGADGCVLALSGGDSHFAWSTSGTLRAARWDGSDLHLVSASGLPHVVAAAGDDVYWGDTTIGKGTLSGTPCDPNCTFVPAMGLMWTMNATSGRLVYGTADNPFKPEAGTNSGAVWQLLDDAGSKLIADNQVYPNYLVGTSGLVFWASQGRLFRADLNAGTASAIVFENVYAMAVHGTALFWTTASEIHTSDLQGHGEKTLARNQTNPRAIGADDTAVYWVNQGTSTTARDGQLMKLDLD